MMSSETSRFVGDFFPECYQELRKIAARRLRKERADHTLRPTELVHEAFFWLCRNQELSPVDRAHFLGLAGRAMRQILIQHARRRASLKRGGKRLRVTLDEGAAIINQEQLDMIALDQALNRLEEEDPAVAEVVQHRYFAGLSDDEIAEIMGRSSRWVRKQWEYARLWLRRELDPERKSR